MICIVVINHVLLKKRAKLREVDHYMRPLLIELHKQYLETKNVTTMSVVSDYMHNLHSKRFAYIYNCFSLLNLCIYLS